MKRNVLLMASLALLAGACTQVEPEDQLVVNLQDKGAEVSPSMYGVFFEEINHAGDGGLYAELVRNRSFEELEMPEGYYAEGDVLHPKKVVNHMTGKTGDGSFRWTTEPVPGWTLVTGQGADAKMELTKERPKFDTAPNNLKLSITAADALVRLVNGGYWGMNLVEGDTYLLRTILRTSGYKGGVKALLLSEKGEVLVSAPVLLGEDGQWSDVDQKLVPLATSGKGKLALEFDGTGTVWLDYVSLFPEKTFHGRTNGLRNDVATMLADLKPAFVRWPGGCVVEGITLGNRYEWKKSLGDPAARPGEYSTWGYRCSYGFGYYEMLQFCEDIHADAMFVCNVGMACQMRMADVSTDDEIAFYVDDCLDAIEYAIGDTDTEWGAKRAAHGHPAPFPLKYVEIGNENWGAEYDKRFDIFYAAIKEKYPQLTLISTHGLGAAGNIAKTDMIDPHWYVAPEFFFQNTTIFDNQPRGKYDIYVGEYACNANVGGGNMRAALSEAAFIGGMERNGDLVKMASYAPLLENRHDRSWPVNLIWLDTDSVLGRSSYYVQKMAAENRPSYNVKSNMTMSAPRALTFGEGLFGFGSWNTSVEFRDVKFADADGKPMEVDLSAVAHKNGNWTWTDGVLTQTSPETPARYILSGVKSNRFTMECQVKKTGGNEGFFLYWGLTEPQGKGYVYNVGGWGNQTTAVEEVNQGRTSGVAGDNRTAQSLETGRWYQVKMVVTPQKSELYMDGKLVLAFEPKSSPMQFFTTGYDEAAGEVVIKVVNAEGKTYPLGIRLEGAKRVAGTGKVITLSATDDAEENSFAEPLKISPQESELQDAGDDFVYEFQPYSYTILRIKAEL